MPRFALLNSSPDAWEKPQVLCWLQPPCPSRGMGPASCKSSFIWIGNLKDCTLPGARRPGQSVGSKTPLADPCLGEPASKRCPL